MHFAAKSVNDRIGKRRKVDKSRMRAFRQMEPRRVAPPFEDSFHALEPVMSGALQDDEVQVRVGTDAFATHTQPSWISHTPVNSSMRQLSVDFDSFPNEPVPLDSEGDIHDAESQRPIQNAPSTDEQAMFNANSHHVEELLLERAPWSDTDDDASGTVDEQTVLE